MIALSRVAECFAAEYPARFEPSPAQRKALAALQGCRTELAASFTAPCTNANGQALRVVPHSCGHRLCPHCQHFESQCWIERQRSRLVPGAYFLVTFTLPSELREIAWAHQRIVHDTLMDCAWQSLREFALNHRHLHGNPGALAALHTHSRALELHPHMHLALPAAALGAINAALRVLRCADAHRVDANAAARCGAGHAQAFNGPATAKQDTPRGRASLKPHRSATPVEPGVPA